MVFGVVEGDIFAVPKSRENIGRLFHAVEGKRSRVRLRRALTRDEASLQVLGVKSVSLSKGILPILSYKSTWSASGTITNSLGSEAIS